MIKERWSNKVTETRNVKNFKEVELKDYGKLIITQGDEESLLVESPKEIINDIISIVENRRLTLSIRGSLLNRLGHALSSGFSGNPILYKLAVKELDLIEVKGATVVKSPSFKSKKLKLRLVGAGDISMELLNLRELEVELPAAGQIRVSGKADSQMVSLTGAGHYQASKLESKNAIVTLQGLGKAVIHVTDTLDATVHGVGEVAYYGNPNVTKNIAGIGRVIKLGNY